MKIKIIETNKIENLEINDVDTGIEYTADLLGNHGVSDEMTQDDFDWWKNTLENMTKADTRLRDLLKDMEEENKYALELEISQIHSIDIEDLPNEMHKIMNRFAK